MLKGCKCRLHRLAWTPRPPPFARERPNGRAAASTQAPWILTKDEVRRQPEALTSGCSICCLCWKSAAGSCRQHGVRQLGKGGLRDAEVDLDTTDLDAEQRLAVSGLPNRERSGEQRRLIGGECICRFNARLRCHTDESQEHLHGATDVRGAQA